ncbi:MAG: smalltalk protein [Bacteroidales bacterium]|nr:smalltalk protein [Bacteroidales bacterium]
MTDNSKKETWRWVLNLIVSVLTALAAALGTNSCVQYQQDASDLEFVSASTASQPPVNDTFVEIEC